MAKISHLQGRQILDSRGWPTVEVEVVLSDGSTGLASVPSGASTGTHESIELRDQNAEHYDGKSVMQAVANVETILQPLLLDKEATEQLDMDQSMVMQDGSSNLKNLGANAVLATSIAISKAAAASAKQPYYYYLRQLYNSLGNNPQTQLKEYVMPTPMFNIMNGGAHTQWQSTDFQEFMVLPTGAESFAQAVEWGSRIYHHLQSLLREQHLTSLVGDEGGFAPALKSNQAAIELIMMAVTASELNFDQVNLGLDPATSELFKDNAYEFKTEKRQLTSAEMISFWQEWLQKYPILSLEDGLAEDDWSSWTQLTASIKPGTLIVGDDLLVTNTERIQKAIELKACNALLLKINQIGTLTESMQAAQLARSAGWKVIVSHRSGDTEDTAIADLAVGLSADFVKMGAPARSERTAKYNQLLRIEEELFAG